MKINVHGGHNFKVQGANGCFSETKEDRNVKNLVISKLKALGLEVYDCTDEDGATQSKNLANIVNKCNAHSVDLDVSIHFNASNGTGHGVEVLVYSDSSKAKPYAQNIVNAIAGLGFTNRGVKVRTNLYVLRKTNAPSLLVECCFCDNQGDANIYNVEKMADAIVKGIVGQTVEVKQETTSPAPQPSQSKPTQTTTVKKGNDLIKAGQQHSINFTGHQIGVDGFYGQETKKQLIRVIQHAMNLDYHAGLVEDGIWGANSNRVAGNHYVKRGEKQYLVTALEIIMMCKGKNPNGVECPGIYGKGLAAIAGEKVTVKQMVNML